MEMGEIGTFLLSQVGGVSPTPKGPPLVGHVPTQGRPQVGMALPLCGECLQKLEVGQVFKNPLRDRLYHQWAAEQPNDRFGRLLYSPASASLRALLSVRALSLTARQNVCLTVWHTR